MRRWSARVEYLLLGVGVLPTARCFKLVRMAALLLCGVSTCAPAPRCTGVWEAPSVVLRPARASPVPTGLPQGRPHQFDRPVPAFLFSRTAGEGGVCIS